MRKTIWNSEKLQANRLKIDLICEAEIFDFYRLVETIGVLEIPLDNREIESDDKNSFIPRPVSGQKLRISSRKTVDFCLRCGR